MKSSIVIFSLFICSATSIANQVYRDEIDLEQSTVINQREFTFAQCDKHLPAISTHSIAGCFFVVINDPIKKFAVGLHWDDDTQRESLAQILDLFKERGSRMSDLEATLVGGWDSPAYYYSKLTGNFLVKELNRWGLTEFNTEHMYEKQPGTNHVAAPIEALRKTRFFSLSFNVCSGRLSLSDESKPPITDESTFRRIAECSFLNPLEEGVPYTGCPIELRRPGKLGRGEL